METTRSGHFTVGQRRPDVDPADVAATDFVSAGGNDKDAEIDSLARQLTQWRHTKHMGIIRIHI